MTKINKRVMVIDSGSFLGMALKLCEHFTDVYYYTEWKIEGFPRPNLDFIGKGFEEQGLTKVDNLFDYIEEIDLFVFLDVYNGDLLEYLKSQGKLCWGSGHAEILEYERAKSLQAIKKLGMDTPKFKKFMGITELENFLKEQEDVFIKVTKFRGIIESFHHETYELTKPIIEEVKHSLGIIAEQVEFIATWPIDALFESGWDSYTVNGKFPDDILFGYEIKDRGFVGKHDIRKNAPPELDIVMNQISPLFGKFNYCGFNSSEIRVTEDKKYYLIDLTQRLSSPCNEIYQELYTNLGEIIDKGSQGILVEPQYSHKYGICLTISSSWVENNMQAIYYPEEISQWVKLRNATKYDNKTYIVPNSFGYPEIGMVIAIGDSIEECKKLLEQRASQIKGYCIKVDMECLKDIDKILENYKKYMNKDF